MTTPPDAGATRARAPVSAVVTTLDNAATLGACLASVHWCDEIVVLDSGSSDATQVIACAAGARLSIAPFAGYGPQKQAALDLATHDWALLLDADEALSEAGRAAIEAELAAPRADGYRLPRREWLFWRWPHAATRPNWQLRLFRRTCGAMNAVPVHAAPEVRGRVLDLDAPFDHHGEATLAVRVDKVNRYSTGLVGHKRGKRVRLLGLRVALYPTFAFWRFYLGKRYFLSGWAGFLAARTAAFYAFLKYAKVLEQRERDAAAHEAHR
jgi:glycosyltransferase involved in cell wall biosynthesis